VGIRWLEHRRHWLWLWEGDSPRRFVLFNLRIVGVFITREAFRRGMGREIVSISVPIGSQEWHLIQAWKQDSKTNVSVNICAALRDNGETIAHLQALQRKLQSLRSKLMVRNSNATFTKDDWDEYFGGMEE
jgi:hypothetical protein